MNHRMICFITGRILMIEAALMLLPLAVSLIYGDGAVLAFVMSMIVTFAAGAALHLAKPGDTTMYAKEGFVIVALAWIAMSLFGALPFYISGAVPGYIDCFFETVSGFTTTGATILRDVESLENSLLFWRSLTHWVGGMGVLVFVMAILPMSDGHGMHLLRAEVPGPTVGKLVSKMSGTAKILYKIYLAMTIAEIVLLLCGGMPLFDALVNSFGTAGTGGFSHKALSIGYYNSVYFEIVIGVFMLLFGINFNLYYFILIGKIRDVLRSEELRVYLIIVAAATAAICINILHMCSGVGEALRLAFFQVSAVITTTGYTTTDFNLWPAFSKGVLVLLMFIGGCAASTSGGMKVARIVLLVKTSAHDIGRMVHPNAISNIHFEGRPQSEKDIRSVLMYFTAFMLLFSASALLLCLEGKDPVTTFTAVVMCLNNAGPGLEQVGPMGSFAAFSWPGKLLLSFDMLAGRLEIFPMLLVFSPSNWRKKRSSGRRGMLRIK